MAVKMRLIRLGKKRSALYRVVVMDGRSPRDGRFIEQIGRYDPNQDPSLIEIDNERAVDWLTKGAQPTDPVAKLLTISGAMAQYQVKSGKVHTVVAKAKVEAPVAHVVTPVPESEAAHVVTPVPESEAAHVATPVPESEAAHVATPVPESEAAHVATPVPESQAAHVVTPVAEPVVEAEPASEPEEAPTEPTFDEVAEEVAEAEAEAGIDASEEE